MANAKNVQKINCHDCQAEIEINQDKKIENGVRLIYDSAGKKIEIFKCQECYQKDKSLKNYQSCEVYSRVVGYLRPINQWNEAKQKEYIQRKEYKV